MMKYDWKIVFYARRRQASRRSHGHVVKVLTEDKFVGATISIGVAVLDGHGSDLGELLKLAAGRCTGQASEPRPGVPGQPDRLGQPGRRTLTTARA
jgi:hypothetical protein